MGVASVCVCVCRRLIKLIKCVKLTALFAKCSPDAGKMRFGLLFTAFVFVSSRIIFKLKQAVKKGKLKQKTLNRTPN